MQMVSVPLGSTGSLVVTEEGGVITATLKEAVLSGGITLNAAFSGSAPALLAMAASQISNPMAKAIVAELGVLAGAMPA